MLYKQGMNEIAAPFLYLNPPPKGEALSYTLFEAFILRYVENFFCKDESIYLFKVSASALQLFESSYSDDSILGVSFISSVASVY